MSDFVPYEEWLEGLSWVQSGDCVYVVSDVLDIAKAVRAQGERFEPHKLIDKLQEMVGKEGTLLFATFNWDFCGGTPFDYYKTPVRTGALSKKALEREEFVRTKHPLYSFAVWGKDQALLEQNDAKTSFGPGTIFAYLYEKNAKVLNVGIPALKGVTYVHHVEQMGGVPYRYHKDSAPLPARPRHPPNKDDPPPPWAMPEWHFPAQRFARRMPYTAGSEGKVPPILSPAPIGNCWRFLRFFGLRPDSS